MGGKYGVENLKQLVDLGYGIGMATDGALADGKIDFADLGQLMVVFPLVQPALDNIDLAPKEYTELDQADSDALDAHMKSKNAGLSDGLAKELAAAALHIGLDIGRMLSAVKKAKAAAKPQP